MAYDHAMRQQFMRQQFSSRSTSGLETLGMSAMTILESFWRAELSARQLQSAISTDRHPSHILTRII